MKIEEGEGFEIIWEWRAAGLPETFGGTTYNYWHGCKWWFQGDRAVPLSDHGSYNWNIEPERLATTLPRSEQGIRTVIYASTATAHTGPSAIIRLIPASSPLRFLDFVSR